MTGVHARSFSVAPREMNRTDALIAALDQRGVGEGASRWVAYVLGVHTDDHTLWIQLASSEEDSDSIVLHLSSDATAEDAITALAEIPSPESQPYPRIIEVSHRT